MWQLLKCSERQLNLNIVLDCGQSFRWVQKSDDPSVWMGVLKNKLWLLKQTKEGIQFDIVSELSLQNDPQASVVDIKEKETGKPEDILKDYFQLDIDVFKLYGQWESADANFKNLQTNFYGIRMLRQDPVENLFSFICSQNNNIARIKQLVEKLCANYGTFVSDYDLRKFYTFPKLSDLTKPGVSEKLRQLGFGYRAKFIHSSAESITNKGKGEQWLYNLREQSYAEVHSGISLCVGVKHENKQLCSLPGVGPKVADCICLMSLDKHDAIPVDVHMWKVATRDYLPHLAKNKTMTNKNYKEIGDFFRKLYGDYAGWAHSVLFSADLRKFKDLKEDSSKLNKRETERKVENDCKKKRKEHV